MEGPMVKIECEKCDKFSTTVEGDGWGGGSLFDVMKNVALCRVMVGEGPCLI